MSGAQTDSTHCLLTCDKYDQNLDKGNFYSHEYALHDEGKRGLIKFPRILQYAPKESGR